MKKLLFLFLFALILSSISCDAATEWENAKGACAKVKKFLQKYGLYDDFVNALNNGAKKLAQSICEKVLPGWLCKDIVNVVFDLIKKNKF